MPLRSFILILFLLCVCFGLQAPAPAHAQNLKLRTGKGGFVLQNANSLSRDIERKLIILEGNVQIIYDQQHLSADRAVIFEATQEIEAEGHLVINSPTVYLEGERARFNYTTGQGIIYNGFVRSGQVVFEGRVVRKLGPEEYEADSAYYTACTTCPPAWSFTGSRIRAKLGSYAHIRNTVIEIGNFPVFWIPYLIVPLKSERQSGLLIPTLDFAGIGGTVLGMSYFWAISRSEDMTLTLRNYSFRGLKTGVNYRYLLSETSGGEANGAILRDRVFAGDPVFREFRPLDSNFDRYYFTFQNNYDLPGGVVQKSRINLVSDLLYPRDFPYELAGFGDPALENRISVTKNGERYHSSLDVQHFTNLLKTNPVGGNSDAVHRLPALRYDLLERSLGESGVTFRVTTEYVNFAREDFAFDDVFVDPETGRREVDVNRGPSRVDGTQLPGSGVFNPGLDVIRAGQRWDLQPEVARPFQIGDLVDVLPVLSLRHTQYAFDVNPGEQSRYDTQPSRTFLAARVGARSLFSRVFGVDEGEARDVRYRHELEPQVTFSNIPWSRQSAHDFFGRDNTLPAFRVAQPASDDDFRSNRGIQFDYEDRLPTQNLVTFALANRIIEKNWLGDAPDYRQVVNFRLSQSYDFQQAQRTQGRRFPWTDVAALLDVNLNWFQTNTVVRYYPYHNATNTSTRARFVSPRSDFFELRFDQQFTITEDLSADYRGRQENIGFGAGLSSRFASIAGAVDFRPVKWQPLDLNVLSWSADLTLRPPGDCWSVLLTVRQVIGVAPIYRFSFEYAFGGGT